MIDLRITQEWLEKSSDSQLEEFKSELVEMLNLSPEDRHTQGRWSLSKTFEGNISQLFYDERVLATLTITDGALLFKSEGEEVLRQDDIMFAVRFVASRISLAVYSNSHKGARLPQNPNLSLDHTFFLRDPAFKEFFRRSNFIPRYTNWSIRKLEDGRDVAEIHPPHYVESRLDGSIHIINDAMLEFLVQKENQEVTSEFSYKVAVSMDDFAKRYDTGLVPKSFYQNYGVSTKIINNTYFDTLHINRKVFIAPYVWDFDKGATAAIYRNTKNGTFLMDKVRQSETLDIAIRRVLRDELKLNDDYVGAVVWGIEFDRDKEGLLTPRLKMNVFVHGLLQQSKKSDHDWVSLR